MSTMAAAISLQTSPPDVLCYILRFLSNEVGDFLRCEKTCRAFRDVLSDDALWSDCAGAADTDYRSSSSASSFRERACIYRVLGLVRDEQDSTENILEDVLGVPGWQKMVHKVLRHHLPEPPPPPMTMDRSSASDNFIYPHDNFGYPQVPLFPVVHERNGRHAGHCLTLRGDTSWVLIQLVQDSLIRQFQRANLILVKEFENNEEAHGASSYPVLTENHFHLQSALQDSSFDMSSILPWTFDAEARLGVLPDADETFREEVVVLRDKIIRRIASRAGVVKLSSGVYHLAWKSLFDTISLLMVPAFMDLVWAAADSSIERYEFEKKSLGPSDSIRNVPPFPTVGLCPPCRRPAFYHTVVPKQIENKAKFLNVTPDRVYGDGWHEVGPATATSESPQECEQQYYTSEDDDGEHSCFSFEDDDSMDVDVLPADANISDSDDDDEIEDDPYAMVLFLNLPLGPLR
jgi:hypothetical protein